MRMSPLQGAVPIVLVSAGVVLGVTSPGLASEARQPAPRSTYGPVTFPGTLQGVSAASASDVWSVGFNSDNDNNGTAIVEHWDGHLWSQVGLPHFKANTGTWLESVDALSSGDAWAVGRIGTGSEFDTLILHWDGSAWTQVPSPSPGGALGSYLYGVSALSASDAWAVGRAYDTPLILHWDGSAWTQVDAPGGLVDLNSVVALSATDAFAVGNTFGGFDRPVVLHWNGTRWSKMRLDTSNRGVSKRGHSEDLNGVSAFSGSDVWAVGTTTTYRRGIPSAPLILHFDGSSWQRVAGAIPSGHQTELSGVSAVNGHNVWAVGSYSVGRDTRTFIEHFKGTNWRQTNSPHPGNYGLSRLEGVDAIGPGKAWTAGAFVDSGQTRTMTVNRIQNRWIQL